MLLKNKELFKFSYEGRNINMGKITKTELFLQLAQSDELIDKYGFLQK